MSPKMYLAWKQQQLNLTPMARLQQAVDQSVTMLMATVMAIKHGVDWTETDPGADATHKRFVESMADVGEGCFSTAVKCACETAIGLLDPDYITQITARMMLLTEEDRLAIINRFCNFCGATAPCNCMRCD